MGYLRRDTVNSVVEEATDNIGSANCAADCTLIEGKYQRRNKTLIYGAGLNEQLVQRRFQLIPVERGIHSEALGKILDYKDSTGLTIGRNIGFILVCYELVSPNLEFWF